MRNQERSYWIPGSYAPALSENRKSFLRLLKNKGFEEERMTKVGLYAIGSSTTLESNKSLLSNHTSKPHFRQSWLVRGLQNVFQRCKNGMWHHMTATLY